MLGKITHYVADVILVSAVIAGIRRSTGLSLATDKIESSDIRSVVKRVLDIGEWVVDQSILAMTQSKYFERKR